MTFKELERWIWADLARLQKTLMKVGAVSGWESEALLAATRNLEAQHLANDYYCVMLFRQIEDELADNLPLVPNFTSEMWEELGQGLKRCFICRQTFRGKSKACYQCSTKNQLTFEGQNPRERAIKTHTVIEELGEVTEDQFNYLLARSAESK